MKKAIETPELLHSIAKIIKPYGTDGSLVIRLYNCEHTDLPKEEPVYVRIDGLPVPFLIEDIRKKGETQAIIKLAPDCSNFIEQMEGNDLLIAYDNREYDGESISPELLVGFQLTEPDGKPAGTIISFLNIPGNPCIEVEDNGDTYIVPLAEELIREFKPEKQELVMELPSGLK